MSEENLDAAALHVFESMVDSYGTELRRAEARHPALGQTEAWAASGVWSRSNISSSVEALQDDGSVSTDFPPKKLVNEVQRLAVGRVLPLERSMTRREVAKWVVTKAEMYYERALQNVMDTPYNIELVRDSAQLPVFAASWIQAELERKGLDGYGEAMRGVAAQIAKLYKEPQLLPDICHRVGCNLRTKPASPGKLKAMGIDALPKQLAAAVEKAYTARPTDWILDRAYVAQFISMLWDERDWEPLPKKLSEKDAHRLIVGTAQEMCRVCE